jgi:hypothetical protein
MGKGVLEKLIVVQLIKEISSYILLNTRFVTALKNAQLVPNL